MKFNKLFCRFGFTNGLPETCDTQGAIQLPDKDSQYGQSAFDMLLRHCMNADFAFLKIDYYKERGTHYADDISQKIACSAGGKSRISTDRPHDTG